LPIPNVFAWFSSRKTSEELEETEVGEEVEDPDKSGAEIKGDKKPQQQVQPMQHHQQNQNHSNQNNNKKQGKSKGRTAVSRKKSNPNVLAGNSNNGSNNDLDETSSTTTESSAVEDLNDSASTITNNKQHHSETNKNNKNAKKSTQKSTQVKNNNSDQHQQQLANTNNLSNTTSSKKKAKKQNSVEGKKTSPERSMGANSSTETIAKVAPATIVKKTPVTPLPTKPRQQVQSELNLNQNQTNLQHQPLQNLSQQNHSSTNASDNNGVQQQQKKVTPVGKILPAIKPPENLGAQFGPVGAKPPMKPAWNNTGHSNDLLSDNNGFSGINGQSGAVPGNGTGNGNEDIFSGSNSNGSSPSRSGHSWMTQLQMNRKQETAQFLAGLTRNDWPGFNETPSTPGGLQNPDNFIANLWDTPDSPATIAQPNNIWGNNGLWSDAGLGVGRGNQQHNATPTSTNYIGGLSVHGPTSQQPNYQPTRDPFGRPDLNHDTGNSMLRPNMTQNDATSGGAGATAGGNGSTGFNGLFPPVMTSIWSNTQTQQPHEVGVQQNVSRSNDELNQFQQNRVAIQQPPTSEYPAASTQAPSVASLNTTNSWSNTLFRQNK